jgi:hypothetical protein
MHRQHDRGAQPLGDVGNAVDRHGIDAVDRHHHDVEPADRSEMTVVELDVRMPEMTDTEDPVVFAFFRLVGMSRRRPEEAAAVVKRIRLTKPRK